MEDSTYKAAKLNIMNEQLKALTAIAGILNKINWNLGKMSTPGLAKKYPETAAKMESIKRASMEPVTEAGPYD